jgi:hypothetical protein
MSSGPGSQCLLFYNTVRINDSQSAENVSIYDHPASLVTFAPVYHNGRLYFGVSSSEEMRAITPGYLCCGFRGSVQALDAATGKLLWKTYTVPKAATPGKNTKRRAGSRDGFAVLGICQLAQSLRSGSCPRSYKALK